VTNSTFFGNTAQADLGGAILNQGTATITNSTITGNTAGLQGGGIHNVGTITVTNSVVAGNTEAGSADDDFGSCGTQSASNLFSTAGTPVTAAQVMLAPLAYYGLNQTVRTMLPLPGSPVIQAGDPTLLPTDLSTDERLLPRTIGGKLDLGAVEANYTSIQFVQQPSNTTVNLTMSPAVTMSVTESGTTVPNIPLPITFVGSGALQGTLNKTTQAPAVAGDPALASFDNLSGDTVGTGYTLTSIVTVTPPAVSPAQTLTATSDPFDITALIPTITFSPAPPTSVVYGSAPITLNGAAYASGTPTGQTVTYQVVSGPGSIAGKTLTFVGVGTVTVNASIAANGNYAAGSTSFNIVVTPAPLTITVANASRAVGAPNPAFSSTASGLVNGDTLGGDITVTYSTTATASSPAGTYAISATIAGSAAGNYTTTIVDGTLTVTAQAAGLDFTLALTSSGSQTVIPGNAASYAVRVAPTSTAYPGTVTFTATGLLAGDTISFTPATIAANGGITPSNVSVQTASQLAANNLPTKSLPILLGVLILPFARSKRMRKGAGRYLWILIVFLGGAAVTTGLTGCGTGDGFFGQAPQTYNINITATSGTIQHSVNVALNVQ
jgi:trimeric autotransporter adhesin